MEGFAAVLHAALAADNTIRNQAEQHLNHLQATNPPAFFTSLAAELSNEQREIPVRQLAGLAIKKNLDAEDATLRESRQMVWRAIDAATRARIKAQLVSALGTADEDVRNAAAQAVAKVGAIELEDKTWPELVGGLIGTAMNGSLGAGPTSAALRTIGYLCEEIPADYLAQTEVNQILTAVVAGMGATNPVQVRRAASAAMYQLMDFTGNNFDDEHVHERNAILKAVCEATSDTDVVAKRSAYACVARVSDLYYEHLAPYIDTLANLTFQAAMNEEEAVAVVAVDFWMAIAQQEAALGDSEENQKYCLRALQPLCQMLFALMMRQIGEHDEDDYGRAQAASLVLEAAAQAVQDPILEHAVPFIKAHTGSADWHAREAAIFVFSKVLEGPSMTLLMPLIQQAMPIVQALAAGPHKDPHPAVRDTCCYALGRVMEVHYPDLAESAGQWMPGLMNTLNTALDDVARVADKASYALYYMAEHTAGIVDEAGNAPLSPYLPTVIRHMIQRASAEDWEESNLRSSCYECINTLIEAAGSSETDIKFLHDLLADTMMRLDRTFSVPANDADEREDVRDMQQRLCAMLQYLVTHAGGISDEEAARAHSLLLRAFDIPGGLAVEEAFRAVGALADAMGERYAALMPAMYPRVVQGLQNQAETSVNKAAVVCCGVLFSALGGQGEAYANDVILAAASILQSAQVDRSVKPDALSLLGDVGIALGPKLHPWLSPIMSMVQQAATLKTPENDDDLREYIFEVRRGILDAWTGIVQGYNSDEYRALALQHLAPFATNVCQVVAAWTQEQLQLHVHDTKEDTELFNYDLFRALINFIGDLATILGAGNVKPFFNKGMDWVRGALMLETKLEQEYDGRDENGRIRETAGQYASRCLA